MYILNCTLWSYKTDLVWDVAFLSHALLLFFVVAFFWLHFELYLVVLQVRGLV